MSPQSLSCPRRLIPLNLSLAALATLSVGVLGPFFCIEERLEGGHFESVVRRVAHVGETRRLSIADGIGALWRHGERGIAAILVVASVLFPLSKSALLWFLYGGRQSHTLYLRVLKQVGPWSMLDAIVVALLAVVHVSYPGGSTFQIAWAYWVFGASIVFNSLALSFTKYHQAEAGEAA